MHQMLDVGDGQQIAYECVGRGEPVVYLHGGPGGGYGNGARRFFDPQLHRAVLFDQRGCGRSRPLAGVDLRAQTMDHLLGDLEKLRDHLGFERWTVLGVSWGTTLGLAYAQRYPQKVSRLILALITATSSREVRWMTEDLGRVYPEAWERFMALVPSDKRPVDAYAELLADPARCDQAAQSWCDWDHAQMGQAPGPQFDDPEFRLRFARLVTHYWRHAAFLEEDQLLREAWRLEGIPGVLLYGRTDLSCPPDIAYRLSRAWSTSRLCVLDCGHGDANAFPAGVAEALNSP